MLELGSTNNGLSFVCVMSQEEIILNVVTILLCLAYHRWLFFLTLLPLLELQVFLQGEGGGEG